MKSIREWWSGVSAKKNKPVSEEVPRCGRIAVIVAHEKNLWGMGVAQSFISSLRDRIGYKQTPDIEILCANNDAEYLIEKLLKPLCARHASGERYEAIVTAGTWCSREVRDVLDTWEEDIPQIFCSVQDPVGCGLVDSLDEPGSYVSGVTMPRPDYHHRINSLLAVCPDKITILVPYSDREDNGQDLRVRFESLDLLVSASASTRCTVTPFAIKRGEQWAAVLRDVVAQYDMVCTLPDVAFLGQSEQVIELCNEKQVPLCTTELTSVHHGASFGFGQSGETYGPFAAAIAYDVLVNGRDIRTTPVVVINDEDTLFFNRPAMKKQGVVLSGEADALLTMQSVFLR